MTEARKDLEKAMKLINEATKLLHDAFNDNETSLNDMGAIMDYARLLNYTDFARSLDM